MPDYLLGLDLGQSNDPSALSVLKRSLVLDDQQLPVRDHRGDLLYQFACVYLNRFPLGTSYPLIVTRVARFLHGARFCPAPRLVIDATGVGRAVVDLFLNDQPPARIVAMTVTSGAVSKRKRWNRSMAVGYWVPKSELVSALQAGLQSRRLKVSPQLPLCEALKKELFEYRVSLSKAAHESFSAPSGAHDDLVMSVAMPLWLGMRREIAFYSGTPLESPALDSDRDAQALRTEAQRERAQAAALADRERLLARDGWHSIENEVWWR